jgi:hypothetical protein
LIDAVKHSCQKISTFFSFKCEMVAKLHSMMEHTVNLKLIADLPHFVLLFRSFI